MSSTLSAHSSKFNSRLVTLDQLRALPEPQALGIRHKPVPHAVLVDQLLHEIDARHYLASRTQFALGANGAALFGVLDLVPQPGAVTALVPHADRGISFGIRSSTNQSLAIQGVAGSHVFVCDNLSLSGDLFAIKRKSTTGLDLGDAIARGFDKFIVQAQTLTIQIERLALTGISDAIAKQVIFDVFNASICPVRLFDDVSRFYFTPADEALDCQPRSLWGLHNAFTRALKDVPPTRQFGATVRLGQLFGLQANASAAPIIDIPTVVVPSTFEVPGQRLALGSDAIDVDALLPCYDDVRRVSDEFTDREEDDDDAAGDERLAALDTTDEDDNDDPEYI